MSKSTYDTTLVEDLAKLINEHELAEIEYDTEGLRLRVTRVPAAGFMAAAPVAAAVPAAAPAPAATAPAQQNVQAEAEIKGDAVKSPMVGVVYLASNPNSPAYVSLGDTVNVGDTVCLIEAMKTYNPVKAHKSGKVTKILVEAGDPVEYGEPLIIIE